MRVPDIKSTLVISVGAIRALRLSSRAATQTRPDCNPQVRIVQLSEVGNIPKQTV
ncbi:hypothetical protein NJB1907f44_38790 [Mycobacterium marinum]|nr:hypothetical protein NJB1907f34b_00360 [Mycobacterium marinum]GJO06805.1 hypothetical protein NJB1808e29_36410 [Mycobacterium marinum]GJO08961.1 hypothetical protein NJB1907E90_24890 [Mycobacterium marinum]GJO10868.1 hypothetical protein NJB1907E11_01500 [Mycobacterium marinum]GJO16355.1 hypothetical protein NJB1728e18_10150 [Mycobacterium marinum]